MKNLHIVIYYLLSTNFLIGANALIFYSRVLTGFLTFCPKWFFIFIELFIIPYI